MGKHTGRENKATLIKHFNQKIEEIEQAYVGETDSSGNPLSEYGKRWLTELAEKIKIDLDSNEASN